MQISLENLKACAPRDITIRGTTYKVIAERYDGYGIFILVHLQDGKLRALLWQDNHPTATPIHFDLIAKHIE
jgi:major membrane immunogen (membrane-anchored lipoprotein)